MTAIPEVKRKCFVVMPFGEKTDLDGRPIDFDDIYRHFFKKAIEGLSADFPLECIRCDEIEEAGSIHEKMFEHIYNSEVVVVDITTSNANVYYELGIRHALAKGVTVLIRRKGTLIPFNLQGMQVVEYDQSKFASIEQAKSRIQQIIRNGLTKRHNDSPVHAVLDVNVEPEGKPIDGTDFFEVRLTSVPSASIGFVTGDIQNVRGIDVWVNSENTNMQMARPFENSISGVVRYLGAEKDKRNGQIKTDTIVIALQEKMENRSSVDPATVLTTTAGAMEQSHSVKRIFHVAANYGQVGQGYVPIDQVTRCIINALRQPEEPDEPKLTSILFPLMAARSQRGAVLEDRVWPLMNAAIDYLESNPDCRFRKVYFLAYTDKERDICRQILKEDGRLEQLPAVAAKGDVPGSEAPVTEGGNQPRLSQSEGGAVRRREKR